MCTVTYVPSTKGGFILTSSRDEKVVRPAALMPQVYEVYDKKVIFPKDPQAGGTWIAVSETRVACLLNGAFEKHISKPPYKKSRGLVLLDCFSYDSISDFVREYDFLFIEPFTLVIHESDRLYELRWNAERIFLSEKDVMLPHIWSSSTLYLDAIIEKRKEWFKYWLEKTSIDNVDAMSHFHQHAGEGDLENDILMNRNDYLKTVSITTVDVENNRLEMIHRDMLNKTIGVKSFDFI